MNEQEILAKMAHLEYHNRDKKTKIQFDALSSEWTIDNGQWIIVVFFFEK